MYFQDVLLKLKAASAGAFVRPTAFFWFLVAALVGPFLLITVGRSESNNMPWYFWAILLLLLFVVIIVGFLRFTRPSNEAEDISISRERR